MALHKWIKKNVYECTAGTAGPYDKVAEGVYNDFQRFHKNVGFQLKVKNSYLYFQ